MQNSVRVESTKLMEKGAWNCFANLNDKDTQSAGWHAYLHGIEYLLASEKIM